jgi:LysR family transcriptional regulator, regulator of abg operon
LRLQRIEQFIAVAEAGSLRAAARRLDMSQPALTRALQQLEEELGVRLMHRSVHGTLLTAAGTAFLSRARVAESELRKAAEEARSTVDEGGLLSLGVSPVGASLLLPEMATVLLRQRPRARLRVLEMAPSTLLPWVRDGAVDLAVTQRTRADLDAGLQYRPLFEINMRVAARPGHPLLDARSLQDLARAAWLYMTAPGTSDDIVSQSFIAEGLPPPLPTVHCGSYFVALDMVAASDMVVVLPPALLLACMKAGRLAEIGLAKPLVPLQVGLYTRADTTPTVSAKAGAQIIVAIARRLAASGQLRTTAALAG